MTKKFLVCKFSSLLLSVSRSFCCTKDVHLPGIYVHRMVKGNSYEKRIEKRTMSAADGGVKARSWEPKRWVTQENTSTTTVRFRQKV
eukprot:6489340-Amphidinium_carterae.1